MFKKAKDGGKGLRARDLGKEIETDVIDGVYVQLTDPRKKYFKVKKIGKSSVRDIFYCNDNKYKQWRIKTTSIIEFDSLKLEISRQSQNNHENIVFYKETFIFNKEIWMIYEFMNGALSDIVGEEIKIWEEPQIACVLKQILEGLVYLHRLNKIHRNITSENVMFNLDGKIKLANLGFYTKRKDNRRSSILGRLSLWVPPEIILGLQWDAQRDVWGTGIAAIEMAEGEPPLMNVEPLRALLLITVNPSPSLGDRTKWSDELHHFLKASLEKDPANRASSQQLLLHPFINKSCSLREFGQFAQTII